MDCLQGAPRQRRSRSPYDSSLRPVTTRLQQAEGGGHFQKYQSFRCHPLRQPFWRQRAKTESGQRKIRGPRSISGKKLATFRCRTASSGSSPRLSNPARHLPEAAFLLEKPCSILGKQPATLRCHRAPPESSSETSRFTSVVGSLSFGCLMMQCFPTERFCNYSFIATG